ncbi:hypothetical protein MIB92_14705 [Aestuariirhabdus sp. Z084]|uniref:hypothetical protein n=1 Tax=Aestuariirhabdus haliotis TaxID=2918751 RepID=UPI00201B3DCD|nr:hypothetical protein [Aestuariirhabdus haliotis]MCL6416909.1 hypothetical protein [Aestuariirhabdus haliotis]MCL6420929.1 hypothetical protein [Aestuariirhabdus haliotis]
MRYVLILFACLTIASCEKTEREKLEQEILEEMGWLYSADPIEDALEAIDNKDYRFMAVYGYSLSIPSVPNKCFSSWEEIESKTKPIKGTSDAIENYEHAKLNLIAREYAERYNVQLFFYLKDSGVWGCDL